MQAELNGLNNDELIRQGNEQYKERVRDIETIQYNDETGYGRKSIAHYAYNDGTGQLELQYTDVYIVNTNGETVDYIKQGDAKWGSIEINGQSGKTIQHQGCVITADAIYYEYMGYKVDPKFVHQLGKNRSDFEGANFTSNGREDVAQQIMSDKNLSLQKITDDSQFKTKLNERIQEGMPTEMRYGNSSGGHSIVVAGYRQNAEGQVISYHISDPGYQNGPLTTTISASSMSYLRHPEYHLQNIQWYK